MASSRKLHRLTGSSWGNHLRFKKLIHLVSPLHVLSHLNDARRRRKLRRHRPLITTKMTQIKYRKDIQMLRGIAVLLVVLFHLGIAGFKSGFLGVDVFFVISGYLMATMYDPGKISEFFTKRARRLLPAYFAIVIFTVLVAIFITTPNDYGQVSSQAFFATVFASNIGFWLENSYFDKAAFKPLLHLWSLGVEIQFYLLVPLVYWIFKQLKISLPIMIAASALLCFLVVGVSPKTSFFWLPFRLWEFLMGFAVAKYFYKPSGEKAGTLAWLGAASLIVIICIPFIHINGEALGFIHGHPGLFALLVSLATATILSFGIPETVEENPISGLLEKVGDSSYSIYLAHFPVIVLFLYQPFAGTVTKSANFTHIVMVTVLVGALSWILFKFVEQPFRANKQILKWAFASFVGVFVITLLGFLVQRTVIPEREMLIYQAWSDRDVYRCGKIRRIFEPGAISCEITKHINEPLHRVLLVGDSHADAIKATFAAAAQNRNVSVYFMIENDPLRKGGISTQGLLREALAKKADSIVMHYSPGGIDYLVVEQLATLAIEKNIKLSFVMPVPVWKEHIPRSLWKSTREIGSLPSQTIDDYLNSNRDFISQLSGIHSDNLSIYQVADTFCRSACRLTSDNGQPLYFDSAHLTLTGSDMLREVFDRVIADIS